VFEVSLGGVLLFIRKAENFGTVGNQMMNKGSSEETSKLTLSVFLLKPRVYKIEVVSQRSFSGTPVEHASASMNAHRNGAKSKAETLLTSC
jgi:hypothetical protein